MTAKKVAIVTGSTSGIGKAIATELAQQGISVMLNSISSVAAGNTLAQALPDASYFQADLSDESQVENLINATLARWGNVDIIVNNAATSSERIPHSNLEAATDEMFLNLFQKNFMSTWYLSRAAMPHLQKSPAGCILNISSIAGTRAAGSSIPYAISKAAINHLTLLLANACGPKVRINAIAPGFVETPRTATWSDAKDFYQSKTTLKKSGQPEEIAKLAMGIINSHFITGQVITADGGFLLG